MSENEHKLSYRDILNLSKGYSAEARQQRLLQKYGPKPANAVQKEKNELKTHKEEKKEIEKVSVEKSTDNSEKQSQVVIQNDVLMENSQINNIPEREVNPIKEFEKILRKYLS